MTGVTGTLALDPLRVAVTVTELTALTVLQELTLPEVVRTWALPSPPSSGQEARVEEALASLVARKYVAIDGDDAYLTSPLSGVLELLCRPEWFVEGIVVRPEGALAAFRVSGSGDEAVLVEPIAPGSLVLAFSPDGRDHVADAALAMELVYADGVAADDGSRPDVMLADLSRRSDWDLRLAFGASFQRVPVDATSTVEWLRLGDRRYRLEASAEGVMAYSMTEGSLRESLLAAQSAVA